MSNGPSGTCAEHGPFLYFCPDCHQRWAVAHPKTVLAIQLMADPTVSYAKAKRAYDQAKKEEG